MNRDDVALIEQFPRSIFDALPLPTLLVDEDVRILDANAAAKALLGEGGDIALGQRGGEALHCSHAKDSPEGCGRGEHCRDCVVRNSVAAAFAGKKVVRQRATMRLTTPDSTRETEFLVTTAPFVIRDRQLALLVLEDTTELMMLRRLLPICAKCKKIRDDLQYWHSLESYLSAHHHVDFTHGLCPDCLKLYLPPGAAEAAADW